MATQFKVRPQPAPRPNAAPRTHTTHGTLIGAHHIDIAHIARVERPNLTVVGLQLILGYEWLASGVDKLLYGRFPATLGQLLGGVLHGGPLPAPFAALLRAAVLPNSIVFGLLVEWGETLAGLGLLAAGLAALLAAPAGRRLPPASARLFARGRRLAERLAPAAAGGAGVMAVSFYLLDGAPAAWLMPSVAFGGALDTGLLLALASVALLAEPAGKWLRRRFQAQRARYQTPGPNASTERYP